jgi:hypothetical protein
VDADCPCHQLEFGAASYLGTMGSRFLTLGMAGLERDASRPGLSFAKMLYGPSHEPKTLIHDDLH